MDESHMSFQSVLCGKFLPTARTRQDPFGNACEWGGKQSKSNDVKRVDRQAERNSIVALNFKINKCYFIQV